MRFKLYFISYIHSMHTLRIMIIKVLQKMEQIWNNDSIQIRNSEVCSRARPQELSARSFYISRVKGRPAITANPPNDFCKECKEIFHKYHTTKKQI